MTEKRLILSTLGFILTAITAHGSPTYTHAQSMEEQLKAADLLAGMIQEGFVRVDNTGKMQINGSVMEILKNYQTIHESVDPMAMSSCQRTTGGCRKKNDMD